MTPREGSPPRANAGEREGGEAGLWHSVTELLGNERIALGTHWSYNLRNDPKRLPFVLARYKFAAKMVGRGRSVLELGCSEGVGVPVLAEFASRYLGVDLDEPAVAAARRNWGDETRTFRAGDFLGRRFGRFDAVVSLDVIEHIYPEYESDYLETVWRNTGPEGICVVGTPNVTAAAHASRASQEGHVNLYDAGRLTAAFKRVFHNVFLFGMNDEVLHTGYAAMAHYLLVVGCYRRRTRLKAGGV